MRLAYSSNGFTRVQLDVAVEHIAALGYAGVEVLADAPHFVPGRDDPRAVAEVLTRAGVAASNVNGNTAAALWPHTPAEPVFEPSLSNSDSAVRRQRMDYSVGCLELAAAIGAPAISVTSGRTEATHPPEEGMKWFAESLAGLCEKAEGFGVRVGVEFEPGLLVETSVELAAIIEAVDHPLLGANLDIGHAICAGEDAVEAIHRLAGRIWNVHLEDIRGRKHFHLVPGEGDIDFDRVLHALAGIGYDGYLTVELYTCIDAADSAARRALAHLEPRVRAALAARAPRASTG
jgi:sugar phosphate isomerase/epimerase